MDDNQLVVESQGKVKAKEQHHDTRKVQFSYIVCGTQGADNLRMDVGSPHVAPHLYGDSLIDG